MRSPRFLLPLLVALLLPQIGCTSYIGPSFVKEPPARVDFANDTGTTIDCTASGSPKPTVSWVSGDGKPIVAIPHMIELLKNGSLMFHPFNPSGYRHDIHSATYRCAASNTVGRILSRDVRVKAVVLQYYELGVHYSKTVIRGNTALIKCSIPNFVKEHVTVTSWLQDTSFNIFPSVKGDGKYHMLPTGELLVLKVEEADKYRTYQCRAMNQLNSAQLLSVGRARFSVTDHPAIATPKTPDKQISMTVRKDQSIVIPCYAEGNPPPSFRWYRQEKQQLRPLMEDERVFQVGECLVMIHADEGDGGLWVCVANNTSGVERIEVNLQVQSQLSVSMQPAGQMTADIGSRAELTCLANGGSVGGLGTSRVWLKDGNVIVPITSVQDQYVIPRVQREDAGMYQCLVRGETESAQASVQLVLGSAHPQLVYKFIQQTLQPGPPVSLKCIATGNPTPHITWRQDGLPLPATTERFLIGQYVTLHGDVISHVNITSVQVEDGGIYQCTATNRVGETSHSADMRVYGPPYVRPMPNVSAVAGEPRYIPCPVAGYPIEIITWEKDGRKLPLNRRQRVFTNGTLLLDNVQRNPDRGEYRCTAENKQGRKSSQHMRLSVIGNPQ